MAETLKPTPIEQIPPAVEFPDHHATAASVRNSDIVTVDVNERGHRPEWTKEGGIKSSGGEFLSYYEMEQIGANKNLITDNPPLPAPDHKNPDLRPKRRFPRGFTGAFRRALRENNGKNPDDPYDNPGYKKAQARANEPDVLDADGKKDYQKSPIDITKIPAPKPKISPNNTPMTAADRIRAQKAKAKAKPAAQESAWTMRKHAKEAQDASLAWNQLKRGQNPDAIDHIEVLEEVRGIRGRLLKSKYLYRLAGRRLNRESFTEAEYHSAMASANHGTRVRGNVLGKGTVGSIRDVGDRRAPRFVVKEEIEGMILPHVVRTDDRGRKRLPDARIPSRPERKRRDALVKSKDGRTWAGGLHSQGREVIAVGGHRGLGVIGVDSRVIQRSRWIIRKAEGLANAFGFDRRRTPNGEGEAIDRVVGGSAATQRDINHKITARVRGPVAPPHPHDRRTPRWQGWGARGHRHMDDGPLPENDRNRLVRPNRYRGF